MSRGEGPSRVGIQRARILVMSGPKGEASYADVIERVLGGVQVVDVPRSRFDRAGTPRRTRLDSSRRTWSRASTSTGEEVVVGAGVGGRHDE